MLSELMGSGRTEALGPAKAKQVIEELKALGIISEEGEEYVVPEYDEEFNRYYIDRDFETFVVPENVPVFEGAFYGCENLGLLNALNYKVEIEGEGKKYSDLCYDTFKIFETRKGETLGSYDENFDLIETEITPSVPDILIVDGTEVSGKIDWDDEWDIVGVEYDKPITFSMKQNADNIMNFLTGSLFIPAHLADNPEIEIDPDQPAMWYSTIAIEGYELPGAYEKFLPDYNNRIDGVVNALVQYIKDYPVSEEQHSANYHLQRVLYIQKKWDNWFSFVALFNELLWRGLGWIVDGDTIRSYTWDTMVELWDNVFDLTNEQKEIVEQWRHGYLLFAADSAILSSCEVLDETAFDSYSTTSSFVANVFEKTDDNTARAAVYFDETGHLYIPEFEEDKFYVYKTRGTRGKTSYNSDTLLSRLSKLLGVSDNGTEKS